MQTGELISLAFYFTAMIGIGIYAWRKASKDVSGYMLGGRQLSPAVTALSAGASDMSGWILMGLPGAMYVTGLSSSWIAIGLVLGAWLNYLLVAPRLRTYTEIAGDAITLPDYFEKRFDDTSRTLRILSALVIIIFFTLYTSSGVVAGGKLFESSFGLSYEMGLWITAGVVVIYTLFGGFLAVSLTDFVQGCIMFVALILVPLIAFGQFDSIAEMNRTVQQQDPALLTFFTGVTFAGIISSMAWGLGYFGQPHIIVRFMAIRSVKDIPAARRIGMSWMIVTIVGALAVGYTGVAYVADTNAALTDPETIFIFFAQTLFHPLISGFLLAAILAAIMSTISSQLLVSSSSLTEDVYKAFLNRDASDTTLLLIGRGSVLAVALIAIWLAYDRSSTILSLVSNAWAGFGAAFGPLILFSLFWRRTTRAGAIAGLVTGASTVLFWLYAPIEIDGQSLSSLMYEIVPGFILASVALVLVSLKTPAPAQHLMDQFDQAKAAAS
ncbi:sodium/proline symporter PutP [Simiduia agarivorans]|uniref:Sodium/proline symporter n=1 Tax=Simiduia agarivorans (strain DSM 21679 / JCM 13881 / BCRC 17597 / SA1) TaxID=1117647 RepID=K4KZK0_SIMAS|nr:sodium/proline symporter PutP [Simiduia agarivorans]AFU99357.1 proline/sodium symporter [Simiduia agarivorans SA1 = DSM 21679]